MAAAEGLSRESPEAAPQVWQEQAGEALRSLMQRLARNADAHGEGAVEGYLALLGNLLGREQPAAPRRRRPHPRVMIWGTQEARDSGCRPGHPGRAERRNVWPAAHRGPTPG